MSSFVNCRPSAAFPFAFFFPPSNVLRLASCAPYGQSGSGVPPPFLIAALRARSRALGALRSPPSASAALPSPAFRRAAVVGSRRWVAPHASRLRVAPFRRLPSAVGPLLSVVGGSALAFGGGGARLPPAWAASHPDGYRFGLCVSLREPLDNRVSLREPP